MAVKYALVMEFDGILVLSDLLEKIMDNLIGDADVDHVNWPPWIEELLAQMALVESVDEGDEVRIICPTIKEFEEPGVHFVIETD